MRVWARLPPHMREIAFDLHDPGWTTSAIEQLGDVLYEFPDVSYTLKTNSGSYYLMPLEISVPEGCARSRPGPIA